MSRIKIRDWLLRTGIRKRFKNNNVLLEYPCGLSGAEVYILVLKDTFIVYIDELSSNG